MKARSEELKNIAGQKFDLCVIGGGTTGAACALDAQLRGIRTVLARRVGMQLHSWRDTIEAAPVIGSLMAAELDWDDATESAAVQQYVGKMNHLLDSAGLSRNRPSANAEASAKGSSTGSVAD